MSNQEIAKLLNNIATAYIIKDEKKFRFQIMAYQKASDVIANLNEEIIDYYKENKLDTLSGIGNTLKLRLTELFKTGQVKHFDWVLEGIPKSIFKLTDIPTFGPKKAFKLVSAFKLNNPDTVIEDLKKIAASGKISSLEGFGLKSQADVLQAISEYELKKGKISRMPLPYALETAEKILNYLQSEKSIDKVEILGSLRRKAATIGDIDFAISTNDPKKAINHFVNYPNTERVIEKGEISAAILVSGGKQIDLLIQPKESFGSLLQHFTGSKNHNIHLREYALKKGLSLSEKGIKHTSNNKVFKYPDEKSFYNALGLTWIPPELREDTGEIEAAQKNQLPKLINLSDIQGDFHLHSNFPIQPSHDLGINSIAEMVEKAKLLNYSYVGFSEHNPSISKHTSEQVYNLISKRNKEIDLVQKNNKNVRIFKLLEIDILPDGSLAIDNKSLSLLDGAIISIHSVFNMDKHTMTNRVIKALSNNKAKIFAHPTGRLLNERNGYELDFDKLFKFCRDNNKAIEINSSPQRLDLPDALVRKAVEFGIKLVINSDSHAIAQMDLQKYGVYVARRGWAGKNDILNTMPYNKINNWFHKGR